MKFLELLLNCIPAEDFDCSNFAVVSSIILDNFLHNMKFPGNFFKISNIIVRDFQYMHCYSMQGSFNSI